MVLNSMRLKKQHVLLIIAVALLVIDQVSKILVKTNMSIGESIPVLGSWFQILFVENKGMAFGMAFGGVIGKIILTCFRICLAGGLIYYISKLIKRAAPMGVLIGLTLITVGAMGNIIDNLFYGLLFSASSTMTVAEFMPEAGGYAPFFLGNVVDMLYFPLIDTVLPTWVPFKGGEPFLFFAPIFNIADSCITCGAFYLLIFHWKYFSHEGFISGAKAVQQ